MSEPKRKRPPKPLTDEEGEVRELTLADFRRMQPVREVMPELIEAVDEYRRKVGRPKVKAPKVHIGFRLSGDLVERIRASGKGYNARVEKALRETFMTPELPTSPVDDVKKAISYDELEAFKNSLEAPVKAVVARLEAALKLVEESAVKAAVAARNVARATAAKRAPSQGKRRA